MDILCLSHLRWDFVYQRPQHLLSRFAAHGRVLFVEEPIDAVGESRLDITTRPCGVEVLVPHLPRGCSPADALRRQAEMIDAHLARRGVMRPLVWYYTPMALPFTRHIDAALRVYDCMDELTAFDGAPDGLLDRERELFACADVVFTGGHSLFEAKRRFHSRVYPFPSSVDVRHFAAARTRARATGGALRVGYLGVIDERLDRGLVASAAAARPDWTFEMLGPVVKIDPETLPQGTNIRYHGFCRYEDLPRQLAQWDVAIIPFAAGAISRFLSPTKLLEYFAAGLPVVSTPVPDVARPYGADGDVTIAGSAPAFVRGIERAAAADSGSRLARYDDLLRTTSWDATWQHMRGLIGQALAARESCASTIS